MKNYDVIVIGGGMMGKACAYYLTREGLKTALIERGGIALGPITGKLISEYVTGKPLYFEEAVELAWNRFTPEKIEACRRAEEENTRMLAELERKLEA